MDVEERATARNRRKWTVQKEEQTVELWAEQPCLFDINCSSYHDRVEKEKKWTDITGAVQMPGKCASYANMLITLALY